MPRIEKWEWTYIKVLLVILLVIVAGCVYVLYTDSHSPFRPHERPMDLKLLSDATGLVFPKGARLEGSLLIVDGLGSYMWGKVVMPAEDVDRFQQAAVKNAKVQFSKGFRMSRLIPSSTEQRGIKPPAWWHPELVREGIGGSPVIGAGEYTEVLMEMLIGPPQGGTAVVYVQRNWG